MTRFILAKRLAVGEEAASLVEYSLLVALVAAASIAIVYGLGQEVGYIFGASNNSVSTASDVITTAS
jgi:Flp pilus assembly pilin Flp